MRVLCDVLVVERVAEPFENVAGGFHAAIDVVFVAAAAEPLGAQAAVAVLHLKGVLVILLDELGGAEILAVERFAAADAGAGGEAQARQAVRAAAGRAANRLGQLFADQPRDVPALSLVVDPGRVGVEVVHQRDQLERQLRSSGSKSSFRLRSSR